MEPRAEQAVGDANGSALNRGDIAVGDVAQRLVEVDAVVVGEFAFQDDFVTETVAEASAEAEVVGVGLGVLR